MLLRVNVPWFFDGAAVGGGAFRNVGVAHSQCAGIQDGAADSCRRYAFPADVEVRDDGVDAAIDLERRGRRQRPSRATGVLGPLPSMVMVPAPAPLSSSWP